MNDATRYRALQAFCRQRALFNDENAAFWLEEADILGRLVALVDREEYLAQRVAALHQMKDDSPSKPAE